MTLPCEHQSTNYLSEPQCRSGDSCPWAISYWKRRAKNVTALDVQPSIKVLMQVIHQNAKDKGFWDNDQDSIIGELARLALITSEIGEWVEALRKPGPSEHIKEYTAAEEEAADVIIRVMDMAQARGYRLGEAIEAKIKFNASRPFRHGKKA